MLLTRVLIASALVFSTTGIIHSNSVRVEASESEQGLLFNTIESPLRLLDTRDSMSSMGHLEKRTFSIPSSVVSKDVEAVSLTITGTLSMDSSWIVVYNKNNPVNGVSHVNVNKNDDGAGYAIVDYKVGDELVVMTGGSNVHAVIDLTGYYSADSGDGFVFNEPTRTLDYNSPTTKHVKSLPRDHEYNNNIVNVTINNPSNHTFVSTIKDNVSTPSTSIANAHKNMTRATTSIIPNNTNIYTLNPSRVIIDTIGGTLEESTRTSRFTPMPNKRLVDSRTTHPQNKLKTGFNNLNILHSSTTHIATTPITKTVQLEDVTALMLNITTINSTTPNYMTITQNNEQPIISHLNNNNKNPRSNTLIIPITPETLPNLQAFLNNGEADIIIDMIGIFTKNKTAITTPTPTQTSTPVSTINTPTSTQPPTTPNPTSTITLPPHNHNHNYSHHTPNNNPHNP